MVQSSVFQKNLQIKYYPLFPLNLVFYMSLYQCINVNTHSSSVYKYRLRRYGDDMHIVIPMSALKQNHSCRGFSLSFYSGLSFLLMQMMIMKL